MELSPEEHLKQTKLEGVGNVTQAGGAAGAEAQGWETMKSELKWAP